MLRVGSLFARASFVVALPIVLFVGTLIWVSLDVGTYERCFFGYGASARTGLGADELRLVAQQFVAHFRDGTPLALNVSRGGQLMPMFTQRELVHLLDVHHLIRFGINALAAIGAVLALAAIGGTRLWRGRYVATLAGSVMVGALLTLAILVVLAIGVFFAFDQLFILFHVLSFPNDFWMLDPRQHYLINLFAQEFFMDTTLAVAAATAGEALVLALVSGVIWWRSAHGPADREKQAGANG